MCAAHCVKKAMWHTALESKFRIKFFPKSACRIADFYFVFLITVNFSLQAVFDARKWLNLFV